MNLQNQTGPKINPYVFSFCRFMGEGIRTIYKLDFSIAENVREDLEGKSFVLLPNHQSNLDIVFEGLFLHHELNTRGHYVMKATLPGILRTLGGIPIIRPREISKNGDEREIKKALVSEAKKVSDELYLETIPTLLKEESVLVMHPEGTRSKDGEIKPQRSIFSNLLKSQEKIGYQIDFLPMDIDYFPRRIIRKGVRVVAGEPINVRDGESSELIGQWLHQINELRKK